MPAYRFFSEAIPQKGESLTLDKEEARHARVVMRKGVGDTLELVNGEGVLAIGTLTDLKKDQATVEITQIKTHAPPSFSTILVQAIPRMNRLGTIIEKATELGVGTISLFPGELSEKKEVSASQKERIRAIIIAASKQSGRLFFPKVEFLPKISLWKEVPSQIFFGSLSEQAPKLLDKLASNKEEISFVVGPEMGLTEKEERALENLGVKGVRLHENILRTDTAPLAALAIIHHFFLS